MTIAQQVRSAMTTAAELDRKWLRADVGHEDTSRYTPWIPFPLYDFVALMAEALPETAGDRFLEVGCGVGSKLLLAGTVFGLNARGIERVPEYVAEARRHGLAVDAADALDYPGYGDFDLLFFNRPLADPVLQAALEAKIWCEVPAGAVVIGANLEAPPPASWYPVLDDGEVRRWISQKL